MKPPHHHFPSLKLRLLRLPKMYFGRAYPLPASGRIAFLYSPARGGGGAERSEVTEGGLWQMAFAKQMTKGRLRSPPARINHLSDVHRSVRPSCTQPAIFPANVKEKE